MQGRIKCLWVGLLCLTLCVPCAVFLSRIPATARAAAPEVTAESMWQGNIRVEESENGHVLSGLGGDWRAEYGQSFRLGDFQTDLAFRDMRFDGSARRVLLELKSTDDGSVLFSVELLCRSDGFDAILYAEGLETKTFSALRYRDGYGVQMRVKREDVLNFDTGRKETKWAARVNDSLATESICEADSAWGAFFERTADRRVRLALARLSGGESCLIACAGDRLLYEPETLRGLAVREGTLGYEGVTLEWQSAAMPDAKELTVRRYRSDSLETETALTGTVISFRDSGLEQGTTYRYEVSGYDSLDVGVTLCPRVIYRFEAIEVTTRQGSSGWFVGTVVGIVAGVAAMIALYACYPLLRNACKRGSKK